jgi:hypothetical protein
MNSFTLHEIYTSDFQSGDEDAGLEPVQGWVICVFLAVGTTVSVVCSR